eukprot:m.16294 g.16294  ORF g.16294 m.16294 type:complete len:314 (-) comp7029_c0_seq1:178-1119(-)
MKGWTIRVNFTQRAWMSGALNLLSAIVACGDREVVCPRVAVVRKCHKYTTKNIPLVPLFFLAVGRPGKMKVKKKAGSTPWNELSAGISSKPKGDRANAKRSSGSGGGNGEATSEAKSAGNSKPARHRSQTDHAKAKRSEHRRKRRLRMKQRKTMCFGCRQFGHSLQDCPESNSGICFRCGTTEHTTTDCKVIPKKGEPEFPYAKCFICKKQGHLSRSCPDNPRGLYPNGGCCKTCGSVEHFAKDCPERQQAKGKAKYVLSTDSFHGSADADDSLALNIDSDDGNGDGEEAQMGGSGGRAPVAKKKKRVAKVVF